MTAVFQGKLDGAGVKLALVVSRFNSEITAKLEAGAVEALVKSGVSEGAIDVYRVPGAFEIVQAARLAASQHDGVVALGCILRGETVHFDLLAHEVTRALSELAARTGRPVAFGVLACETVEQARERAGGKEGNRGADAALACLEMVNLVRGRLLERR